MKGIRVLALTILTVFGCTISAHALPISFGSNYYEFVIPSSVTSVNDWFSVNTAANSSTYLGFSGHLATITSAAENNFLIANFATGNRGFEGAWLGGKSPVGWLAGPENGQAFTYTNWGGAEPNNSGYAYMNIGALYAGISTGQWADDSEIQGFPGGGDPVSGYFVEYEGSANNNAVPEPSSLALLSFGLFGLIRRRFKA